MTKNHEDSGDVLKPEITHHANDQAEPKFSRIGNKSFVGWVAGAAYAFFKMPTTIDKENLSANLDRYFSSPRKFR